MKKFLLAIIISLIVFSGISQDSPIDFDSLKAKQWIDSVMITLSPKEKIGQLFIVRANYPGKDYNRKIPKYLQDYNLGGVTFFRGDAIDQAEKTNEWQAIAKVPLFISIDGEWGLGMRLNDAMSFPYQMTLGAINNDNLIYEMGRTIGKHCKRMGIQINFAPVVDVNSNPANPIIGMRSFGEDKDKVSQFGIKYMKGLQDEGIIATAKHFPGHGDTDSDSHLTLPIINHDKARLNEVELYPFKKLINAGLDGIMIAHLYIPSIENTPNVASTLSKTLTDSLLRTELGFNGLIVTDALDMKGVRKYFKNSEIALMALKAGNDILLLPEDFPDAVKAIERAVQNGEISYELIDQKCRKILYYKYKTGLNNFKPINTENLVQDLNNGEAKYLKRKLFENAITLVKNIDNIIPLEKLDTLSLTSVSIGSNEITPFQKSLRRYSPVLLQQISKSPKNEEITALLKNIENKNLVILDFQHTSIFPFRKFGLTARSIEIIDFISNHHKTIVVLPSCPYALKQIPDKENIIAIIVSYQDDAEAQDLSAQLIFGGFGAKGKLAVSSGDKYPLYTGIETNKTRLKYSVPEEFGIGINSIASLEVIIEEGLAEKAYPGCQVIAAKDGIVFFDKSYGYHTYSKKNAVKDDDIYDLASLTKIAATAPAMMKMEEDKKIDPDKKLSSYLQFLKGTDKENMIISEILCHKSGLKAWIPYYKYVIEEDGIDTTFFNKKISDEFPVRVAENLYTKSLYKYIIFDSIKDSKLREEMDYKYSDLGFYLMAQTIEEISNNPFQIYVDDNFYKPLGLSTMGFLPRQHFSLNRIIPTENDKTFRKQLLHGDVHDQGAALIGGVSGHAGLFSSANDMAVLMQMFLDKGNYGGEQFLDTNLILKYTSVQFPLDNNRRGLAFDKPLFDYVEHGPHCKSASPKSFGHSGFTGTYAWADPENGLVYIFLSNRIHPDMNNTKIMDHDLRTRIHQKFYDLLNTTNND